MKNNKIIIISIGLLLSLSGLMCATLNSKEEKQNTGTNLNNNLKVYAYIDGEASLDFPTTNNYYTNIICKSYTSVVTDVVGTAKWNGTRWQVDLANLNSGNAVCNVYFTSKSATVVSAPNGWYEVEEGTLLAGIRNNNPVEEPLTTPGVEISTNDEAVLASAEDDYGTSFYFRGNVQNNYVAFAGMCWRIVRITGDGSIKLVLYNYSSDDCSITGDDLAFAKYSGDTYKTQFNSNSNDNTYVGFMYGTAGSSAYIETHKNKFKSTILMNLETWYKNYIATYEGKLADIIWCNDKSTSSGTGIGTAVTNYGAYIRYQSTSPSLICPNDNNGGKLSHFTVSDIVNGNGTLDYKIGLLTADEVIYAGLKWYTANSSSNYLKENTNSSVYWWTLSPVVHNGTSSVVYAIGNTGLYSSQGVNSTVYVLRPSLALKSTTTISSGNGTASSPFIVN